MAGKGIPELLNYKQKGKDLNEFIKVPVSEKLAYCFGDPALTLMYTMTTTLLIYFYTNVVGISAGAVGMIMLLSRIFDGFSDVLMGGGGGGGGGARRGAGETKLELDRRYLRSRIEKLESRLKELEKRRGETRRARQKNGVPVISLVGYTNVGKREPLRAHALRRGYQGRAGSGGAGRRCGLRRRSGSRGQDPG